MKDVRIVNLMRTTQVHLVAGVVSALASYVGSGGIGVAHADDRGETVETRSPSDHAPFGGDRASNTADARRGDYDPWGAPESGRDAPGTPAPFGAPPPNMPPPSTLPGFMRPDAAAWPQLYPTVLAHAPQDLGPYPRTIRDRPGILPEGVYRLGVDGGVDSDRRLRDEISAGLGLGHDLELVIGDAASLAGPDLQTPRVELGYGLVDQVRGKVIPRVGLGYHHLPDANIVRIDGGIDAELELSPALAVSIPAHQVELDMTGQGAVTTLALPIAAQVRLRPTLAVQFELTALRVRADAPNDWHAASVLIDATPFALETTWSVSRRIDLQGLLQRDLSPPGMAPVADAYTALVGLRVYGLL